MINDETSYLWYRRNVTLTQTQSHAIVAVQMRKANALLFFFDGEYVGEFDNHDHTLGNITAIVALDLSKFNPNQQYLFEILSISLGLNSGIAKDTFDYKDIVGTVMLNRQSLMNDNENLWVHQKGLVGEYYQIYTEEGSSKVDWDTQWTKGIDKPIIWFQARFDLDHLAQQDTNANPVLLDAQGLTRGHAFINGNDIGLYWLIQSVCDGNIPGHCQQAHINCFKPIQRYYHIPSDWLKSKDNLITIFDDLGAFSPGSVGLIQRVVI